MEQNVWGSITEENGKYFASSDKIFLDKIQKNTKYKKLDDNFKLDLSVIPLHFVGDIRNAKVLVLNLNPGIDEKYLSFYNENKEYQEKIINNLTFKDPKFFEFDYYTENNEGYWSRLSPLFSDKYSEKISKNKISEDTQDLDIFFTKNIALVEFFPYHSKKFFGIKDIYKSTVKEMKEYLPSQQFVFNIIRERIENKNVIILFSRAATEWIQAIPEIKSYNKAYKCSNPLNPSFKLNHILKLNMGEEILEEIKN